MTFVSYQILQGPDTLLRIVTIVDTDSTAAV